MTFKTDMTTDLSVLFNTDEFAETVTYSGEDISAVVDYGLDQDMGDEATVDRALLCVKQSDVSSPAYRDAVVIGTATWYVKNVKSGDGYVWVLEITKDERPVL